MIIRIFLISFIYENAVVVYILLLFLTHEQNDYLWVFSFGFLCTYIYRRAAGMGTLFLITNIRLGRKFPNSIQRARVAQ